MLRFNIRCKRLLAICCALFICASLADAKVHRGTAKSGLRATSTSVKSARTKRSGVARRSNAKGKRRGTATARVRGQQAIDGGRVREIQEALIRAKYLDGEPSGVWDAETKGAMTRFQSDNGWQSRVVPDSRALIKLGLGPDHSRVMNPETSGINTAPAVAVTPASELQNGGGITQ